MKKSLFLVLFALVTVVFSSCSKDDDENNETTYTVAFNAYDGISTTVRIFECNDNGDKIGNNSIKFKTGDEKAFTASPNTSKIKIYLSTESAMGNVNKWVQQVYILKKGNNTKIEINDNTLVGNIEP